MASLISRHNSLPSKCLDPGLWILRVTTSVRSSAHAFLRMEVLKIPLSPTSELLKVAKKAAIYGRIIRGAAALLGGRLDCLLPKVLEQGHAALTTPVLRRACSLWVVATRIRQGIGVAMLAEHGQQRDLRNSKDDVSCGHPLHPFLAHPGT